MPDKQFASLGYCSCASNALFVQEMNSCLPLAIVVPYPMVHGQAACCSFFHSAETKKMHEYKLFSF
jgi:hypothetical protein